MSADPPFDNTPYKFPFEVSISLHFGNLPYTPPKKSYFFVKVLVVGSNSNITPLLEAPPCSAVPYNLPFEI